MKFHLIILSLEAKLERGFISLKSRINQFKESWSKIANEKKFKLTQKLAF